MSFSVSKIKTQSLRYAYDWFLDVKKTSGLWGRGLTYQRWYAAQLAGGKKKQSQPKPPIRRDFSFRLFKPNGGPSSSLNVRLRRLVSFAEWLRILPGRTPCTQLPPSRLGGGGAIVYICHTVCIYKGKKPGTHNFNFICVVVQQHPVISLETTHEFFTIYFFQANLSASTYA